ncbi:MAG: transposase [Chthoniobacterales bacterium]
MPNWVEPGALFRIRIRLDHTKNQRFLTESPLSPRLLDSARFYEKKQRWHIMLFLLMPDHVHAILSFASDQPVSLVVGDWKN